ncbi:MAG: hypothetical protein AAF621_00755, partial [Pseudomonadota bacterium]
KGSSSFQVSNKYINDTVKSRRGKSHIINFLTQDELSKVLPKLREALSEAKSATTLGARREILSDKTLAKLLDLDNDQIREGIKDLELDETSRKLLTPVNSIEDLRAFNTLISQAKNLSELHIRLAIEKYKKAYYESAIKTHTEKKIFGEILKHICNHAEFTPSHIIALGSNNVSHQIDLDKALKLNSEVKTTAGKKATLGLLVEIFNKFYCTLNDRILQSMITRLSPGINTQYRWVHPSPDDTSSQEWQIGKVEFDRKKELLMGALDEAVEDKLLVKRRIESFDAEEGYYFS